MRGCWYPGTNGLRTFKQNHHWAGILRPNLVPFLSQLVDIIFDEPTDSPWVSESYITEFYTESTGYPFLSGLYQVRWMQDVEESSIS